MVDTIRPISKKLQTELEAAGVAGVGGCRAASELSQRRYEALLRSDLEYLRERLGLKPIYKGG